MTLEGTDRIGMWRWGQMGMGRALQVLEIKSN